jgi:hypothetical protein
VLQTENVRVHELIVLDDTNRKARDFLPLNKLLQKGLQLLHVALIGLGCSHRPTRSGTGDHQSDEECNNALLFRTRHFATRAAGGGEAAQRHLAAIVNQSQRGGSW